MYEKLYKIIEREKGGFPMRVGIHHRFATDNGTLCQPFMYMIYTDKIEIEIIMMYTNNKVLKIK